MTTGTRKGRPITCPDCGDSALAISLPELSWPVLLEAHDLPITADLLALVRAFEVWEYAGERVGWVGKCSDRRTWRPLRARHRCTAQHIDVQAADRWPGERKNKHKNKHKNKKENTHV